MILMMAILGVMVPALGAYAQHPGSAADAADGESDKVIPDAGPVKIGGLFPLTGGLNSTGIEGRAAAELAITDFNAYLAERGAGWWLEMVVEDTATDPAVSLEKVEKLHEEGIVAMLGPMASDNVQGVKEYADQSGVLIFSCCSSAPALAVAGDSVYRLAPDDSGLGSAIGRLAEHNGIEALVPIWRGEAYGDGLWLAVADDFESRGGAIHAGVRYSQTAQDLSMEVALLNKQVREAVGVYGADRVAVLMISFEEYIEIIRTAADHGALEDVVWLASESATITEAPASDDTAARFAEMVDLTAIQIMTAPGPEHGRVTEALARETGRDPRATSYHVYDSVWILGRAIVEAGSTDAADIKRALPGAAAEHSGALLSTDLNEVGDLLPTDYRIVRVSDGDWAVAGNYSARTDTVNLDAVQLAAIPQKIAAASNGFAVDLYRQLSSEGGNVFFSPISAYAAFSIIDEGARGETSSQLQKAFGFEPDGELRHDYTATMMSSLNQRDPHTTLKMANSLWLAEWFEPFDSYVGVVSDVYQADVNTVDFLSVGADRINEWAAKKTQGKIQKVLEPGALDESTASVILNAIYFKGAWGEQFPAENTHRSDFWNGTHDIKADFMRVEDRFDYTKSDGVQVLSMPYEGDRLSMLVVLPTDRDGIGRLEETIAPKQIDQWRDSLYGTKVTVSMPKFEIRTHYDLIGPLNGLGVVDVFDASEADLTGIADLAENLYVSQAVQDAYIQVSEEGTEAAAVTTGVVVPTSAPEHFVADRPFIFLIQDDGSGTILFMGRVSNPS